MIKPNNQIVLLASEAEDIDAAYDSMEGQQDYVSIGGIEIPVGFDRSENTFYLLDDGEASRDALDKAKKLLKKFGGGQLKPTPNTKDNLAGKDYVAFADGNTYQVNTYTESVKTFESKRKVIKSKKNEAVGDIRRDVPINDTMYSSKLKSLVRKLKTLGASVKPNVYADENPNDKSAEYKLLGVYGNDGITVDVDIYEGKHTSITVITNRGNMIMNGEGSSFASALSALGILEESNKSESKKNESTDTIKMGIDYTMFMRMCESAAFLDKDEDYWDALWEYYSGIGEIDDALVFFDNLFQYTSWKDVEETYDEFPDEAKDDTKDKEEVIDAYLDENGEIRGNTVTKYGDHYLWVY